MSQKRYFLDYIIERDDEVWCAYLSTIKAQMQEDCIAEATIIEAKRVNVKDDGYFYCGEVFEWGEINGSCGRFCGQYEPRNGKNGCCKYFSTYNYVPGDKKRVITVKIEE